MVPPWNDGSKNLVRDVAAHLTRARPTVLTTPGASAPGPRVAVDAVYRDGGRFAPSLAANGRVFARLLGGDPHDLWAFAFAPNPPSSMAARAAIRGRRLMGFRGPVVQIVASAPRTFDGISTLFFGDAVVVLSEWTRGCILGADPRRGPRAASSRLRVIPPCAVPPRAVAKDDIDAFRRRHHLGDGPLVLYPGDYEVSRGARTVAEAVPRVLREVPAARFVFACRAKTPRAGDARSDVERALAEIGHGASAVHLGEVADMPVLLAASSVVAFPVDDLYGKVDVPLVLLEALAMGVPVVAARGGSLEALTSALFVEPADAEALSASLVSVLTDRGKAQGLAEAGQHTYTSTFHPRVVAARYDDLFEELLATPRRDR